MLQFSWIDESGQHRSVLADQFPFTIGRGPAANLRLDSAGVWERHAEVILHNGKFLIQSGTESLLLINSERTARKALLPGDVVQAGAIRLGVSLAPASSAPLASKERLFWAVAIFISVLELWLAFRPLAR